jgi:hypothetical protein
MKLSPVKAGRVLDHSVLKISSGFVTLRFSTLFSTCSKLEQLVNVCAAFKFLKAKHRFQ